MLRIKELKDAEGRRERVLLEWFEVLKDPVIMISAIITAIFTLVGAFLGVYLSSKSAFKLARFNRQDSIRRELNDFKIIVESLELEIPQIYSLESMNTIKKAELLTMIEKVKEQKYIEKLVDVKKPTTIGAIEINNIKGSFGFLQYCIDEEKEIDMIFSAYQSFRAEIRNLKVSLKVAFI